MPSLPQPLGKVQDSLDQCPIQTSGLEGKVKEDILDRRLLELTSRILRVDEFKIGLES